jgi:hypothetical protein
VTQGKLAPDTQFSGARRSIEDFTHHFAVHVRQAPMDPIVIKGETLMINAKEVQDGGVKVVPGNSAFDRLPADLVGSAISDAMP